MAFWAEDNTGVRVRRLVEGTRIRGSRVAPGAPVGCGDHNVGDAYTYLQPCAGVRGLNGEQVVQVANVCVWGDGAHEIRGLAVDTGGGEALSDAAATVKVDCTAPVVSAGPDSAADVEVGETVAPAVSAVDAHAGVTETETEVDLGDGSWRPYDGPVQAAEGSVYRFRARATDAAGNVSEWSEPSAPISARARPTGSDAPPPPDEEGTTDPAPPTPQPPATTEVGAPRFDEAPLAAPSGLIVAPARRTDRPQLRLTTARRLAGGRRLRIAGTATNVPARSSILLTVRDARGRRMTSKRVLPRRTTFSVTIRLAHATRKPAGVEAQLRTPDGRTATAAKTLRWRAATRE